MNPEENQATTPATQVGNEVVAAPVSAEPVSAQTPVVANADVTPSSASAVTPPSPAADNFTTPTSFAEPPAESKAAEEPIVAGEQSSAQAAVAAPSNSVKVEQRHKSL
jgi:hypothetical protein